MENIPEAEMDLIDLKKEKDALEIDYARRSSELRMEILEATVTKLEKKNERLESDLDKVSAELYFMGLEKAVFKKQTNYKIDWLEEQKADLMKKVANLEDCVVLMEKENIELDEKLMIEVIRREEVIESLERKLRELEEIKKVRGSRKEGSEPLKEVSEPFKEVSRQKGEDDKENIVSVENIPTQKMDKKMKNENLPSEKMDKKMKIIETHLGKLQNELSEFQTLAKLDKNK